MRDMMLIWANWYNLEHIESFETTVIPLGLFMTIWDHFRSFAIIWDKLKPFGFN